MQKDTELKPAGTNPGYEKRDVNTRAITYASVVLFMLVIASLLSMYWVFDYFSKTQKLGPTASPFIDVRQLPPEPRLQVQPLEDLNRVRQSQEDMLNSYDWTDRANGNVRVPIDRAMDLIIERGLPTRPSAPTSESVAKEQGK
jgi:hypothetical protein